MVFFLLFFVALAYSGLLVFTYFGDCDPLSAGIVSRKDQVGLYCYKGCIVSE